MRALKLSVRVHSQGLVRQKVVLRRVQTRNFHFFLKISHKIDQSGLIFASGISLHLGVTNQANSIKSLFEG